MKKTLQFTIVNGPSTMEMFDALRLIREGRKLSITIQRWTKAGEKYDTPDQIEVHLKGIATEDESGENWLLGFVSQFATLTLPKRLRLNPNPSTKIKVAAVYSTKTRQGSFQVEVDV